MPSFGIITPVQDIDLRKIIGKSLIDSINRNTRHFTTNLWHFYDTFQWFWCLSHCHRFLLLCRFVVNCSNWVQCSWQIYLYFFRQIPVKSQLRSLISKQSWTFGLCTRAHTGKHTPSGQRRLLDRLFQVEACFNKRLKWFVSLWLAGGQIMFLQQFHDSTVQDKPSCSLHCWWMKPDSGVPPDNVAVPLTDTEDKRNLSLTPTTKDLLAVCPDIKQKNIWENEGNWHQWVF